MRRSHESRRGNALIEFTLVGIPLMFVLFSIFEVARGMWHYTTLRHAVDEATRFAIVHGDNCSSSSQSCSITVSQVAARFTWAGAGLDPTKVQLELRAGCAAGLRHDSGPCASVKTGTLQALLSDSAVWPDFGSPGFESLEVLGTYEMETPFAMFWPGAGSMQSAPSFSLSAVSREMVQF